MHYTILINSDEASTHDLRIEVNQPGFEIFTRLPLDSVSTEYCN